MSQTIVLGEGCLVKISGADFPLKAGVEVEVNLDTETLLSLLDLTEEQHRLLQLGANLFKRDGEADRRSGPRNGEAIRARASRSRAVPQTQDPWTGQRVFSPGMSHLSEETRALLGIDRDRGRAKTVGAALRTAREQDPSRMTGLVDRYSARFSKAGPADKKKLLNELLAELKGGKPPQAKRTAKATAAKASGKKSGGKKAPAKRPVAKAAPAKPPGTKSPAVVPRPAPQPDARATA